MRIHEQRIRVGEVDRAGSGVDPGTSAGKLGYRRLEHPEHLAVHRANAVVKPHPDPVVAQRATTRRRQAELPGGR
jgi:hypothetical protein